VSLSLQVAIRYLAVRVRHTATFMEYASSRRNNRFQERELYATDLQAQ
jgi:hypothetical protein